MEKIIIEAKQPRALKQAMGSFVLLLLSLSLCIIGMKERRTLYWLIGFMATMFFVVAFLIFIGKTKSKKPLLTITFDGIIDSTTSSIGYISYMDINKFHMVTYQGIEVIGVEPKDINLYIKKLPPNIQEMARIRIENQEHPFIIDVTNAKDMTLEDIYTLLNKRLRDNRSLYD